MKNDICKTWFTYSAIFFFQIGSVLKELVITSQDIQQIKDVFTQQMNMANSANPDVRSKSDMLMENTHIRQLMDGTGNKIVCKLELKQ